MNTAATDTAEIKVGAVVLAAGRGSRFGMPKVLASFPDGPLFVAAIAQSARSAGVDEVVVVAPPGVAAADLGAPLDATWVTNPEPDRGMASSVRAGLAAVGEVDAALVWPVDCPRVSADTVRALIAEWRRRRAPIVLPSHARRRGHPALFDAALLPSLRVLSDDAADGLRRVVRAYADRIAYVEAGEEVLDDFDRVEDVKRCAARGGGGRLDPGQGGGEDRV